MLKPDRSDWLGIGAIMLLAFVLRLWGLNATLWYDEITTLVDFTRPSFSVLLTEYPSLNHHVLFSLLAKGSIQILGETPFALRLPAALMGLVSIWVLWLLIWEAGRILKSSEIPTRWIAHLTALFFATTYHHIWFSQNARGYTGVILFSLLAILFYLRGQRSGNGRNWLWMSVSLALGLYTHLSAALLFSAFGIVYLFWLGKQTFGNGPENNLTNDLKPLWAFAGGVAGALVLLLPMLGDIVSTFTSVSQGPGPDSTKTDAIAHWKNPLWMLKEVASSLSTSGPIMLIGGAGICAILGGGMFSLSKRGGWLLPAIVLVHIPLTIILLQLGSMRVWPRYFLIDLPFLCYFLIEGAFFYGALTSKISERFGLVFLKASKLGFVFSIVGILASASLLPKNYTMPKQPYVAARDHINANRSDDSEVTTLGMASVSYNLYYAPEWLVTETLKELVALESANKEVWLVYAFPNVTEGRYPDIFKHLVGSWTEVADFDGSLGDGNVVVWRTPPKKR